MKTKSISAIAALALFIAACSGAPAATPTISGADVQSTAIAAAFTVVAETHAVLPTDTPAPTETPIPPTATPMQTLTPTETSAVAAQLPTATPTAVILVQATPTTVSSSGSDPCNAPLLKVSGGTLADFRIVNESDSPITASLYLNKTPFGDCGYRGYNIAKGDSVAIKDLVLGCYNVSVFVNSKKPSKAFGYGCINNTDRWTFFVYKDKVVFSGK